MHEAIASSLQRRQVITSTEIKKILGYYKKVTDFIEKSTMIKFTLAVLLLSLMTFALHIIDTF